MSDPRPTGVRRAARQRPTSGVLLGSTAVAVASLVAAAILVLVTPSDPGPAPRPSAATGAPVSQITLGCPRRPNLPEGVSTSFGVASVVGDDLGQDGSVTGAPRLSRGEASEVVGSTERGVRLTGTDGLAQGLVAWRADTGSSTAITECPSPRASWWFTGLGASIDHESTLTIANLDSGPAVVDIKVLSPEGEIDVAETGGSGITLAPGESRTLSLVALAPQNDELAIRVHASRGRVVAAVSDRFAETPAAEPGFEWLPSQIEPARILRLSGVPAGSRFRTLLVANPSDLEAVVTVELAGPSGRVLSPDLNQLSVDPGALLAVDLSALADENVAVRLVSDLPVVAVLRSVVQGGDIVYAGPAQALTTIAGLPVIGRSTVHLTALGEAARATVTAYSVEGESVGGTTISLDAHATDTWKAPRLAAYVVVEPAKATVFGSIVYSGESAVPLRDLPTTIRIPAVRPAA
ncbi:MAG TPA: DUF5719 family protein [Nocardioidaceae bacterium]|nr:DUF5719 family protein [Nocardioidaceae bacterium]